MRFSSSSLLVTSSLVAVTAPTALVVADTADLADGPPGRRVRTGLRAVGAAIAGPHDIAGDKPIASKSKLIRVEDISLLSDAENIKTAQLLQLIKDHGIQVTAIDLDAEIARVAEEVFESHAPADETPPDDPSMSRHPDAGKLKLSENSASTSLTSGEWCLLSYLWMERIHSGYWSGFDRGTYYYHAFDSGVNWNSGCDKCLGVSDLSDLERGDETVYPGDTGIDYWYKCP